MTASATTLTDLHGLGALTAGKILGRAGDVGRFRSAAAFASYTGTAPIEVSSGDVVRHRLSRAGDRQLKLLPARHGHHPSPPRHPWQGLLPEETIRRQESQRSHAVSETAPLRPGISTAEPRRSQTERQAREDTRGRLYRLARPAETPHTGSSDKSLPGPAPKPYNPAETELLDTERRQYRASASQQLKRGS
ncbi:MAG TPA: IS110 family transposase [Mycobacterium sp.]